MTRARSLVLAAMLLAGCYRPSIGDGALRCGPGGLCPEGFVCNTLMVCAKKGGAAIDLSGDAGPLFSGTLGKLDLTGITGTLECSTKSGEMKVTNGADPERLIVPAGTEGFAILPQASGPSVGIWSFASIAIPKTITVKPQSESEAIPVFAAIGAVNLEGPIDWRSFGGFRGRPREAGTGRMSGVMSGGGAGMNDGGGGGGGHAVAGNPGMGTDAGIGGEPVGNEQLMPVHTGSGGGGGGNAGGAGGNGGGSVIVITAGDVTLASRIDVSGSVGSPANAAGGGGGGGGSGGSILVSGARVTLNDGHELFARGGTGGVGMGTGGAGGDGAPGRIWIGGEVTMNVTLVADPAAVISTAPVSAFPQQ